MTGVLPEAWQLVEHDHLDRSEPADFTCLNAIRMLTSGNPRFFEGTAVESHVTVVHPGATRTERTIEAVAREATRRGLTEAGLEEEIAQANPIHHFVDAREVAWVVAFLASPKSIAITGDAIAVGGGQKNAIHYEHRGRPR